MTPTEVLFAQASTGDITTLAIPAIAGDALALMCTTATANSGQIVIANVISTGANYLYVLTPPSKAGPNTVTISSFLIGHTAPVTLTPVGTPLTVTGAGSFIGTFALQTDPSGLFLTLTDTSKSVVHIFLITQSTGALTTEAPGSPFPAANAFLTAAAVNGLGEFLYVTDNEDGLIFMFSVNVNSATNVLTALAGVSINASGGIAANSPISMLVNSTATLLYTANNLSISIFAISGADGSLGPAVGLASPVVPAPAFSPQLLAVDFTNSFLYATGQGTEGVLGYMINGDGSLQVLNGGTPFASGLAGGVTDIVADPTESVIYLLINGVINPYTISTTSLGNLDPPTGTQTFTSSTNIALAGV
ncbi:MAG: hypothetical protein WB780_15250 [Candidatus Acidiferrales bacterium]